MRNAGTKQWTFTPVALAAIGLAMQADAQTMVWTQPKRTAVQGALVIVNGSNTVRDVLNPSPSLRSPMKFGYSTCFGELSDTQDSYNNQGISARYGTSILPESYVYTNAFNHTLSQKVLDFVNVPGMLMRLNCGYLDWERTVGASASRKSLLSGWDRSPGVPDSYPPTYIGLNEYLQFVEKIKGEAIIVLNLTSLYGADLPNGTPTIHAPGDPNNVNGTDTQTLIHKAVCLMEYMNAQVGENLGCGGTQGLRRQQDTNGHGPYNMWRFELDNEPNNAGAYRQSNGQPYIPSVHPEVMTMRANAVINAMRSGAGAKAGNLKFIGTTMAALGNMVAKSFDANVLVDGTGGQTSEPLAPTSPGQGVMTYTNRVTLAGTAGMSQTWNQVTTSNPATQYAVQGFNLSDGYYSDQTSLNISSPGIGSTLSSMGVHLYADAPVWGVEGTNGDEASQFSYYDEFKHWWYHDLPIVSLLPAQLTKLEIDAWAGSAKTRPSVSVTEYNRDGPRLPDVGSNPPLTNVNQMYAQLNGLGAALINTDLVISMSQLPYVDMVVHHGFAGIASRNQFGKIRRNPDESLALSGTDPATGIWINRGDGTYEFEAHADGSATMLAASTLTQANILGTTVASPNAAEWTSRNPLNPYAPPSAPNAQGCCGNYIDGYAAQYADLQKEPMGYDVRATGFQYQNGVAGVLAVNRSAENYPMNLSLPGVASGDSWVMRLDSVGGDDHPTHDRYMKTWRRYGTTTFATDSSSNAVVGALNLPGHAVFVATAVGHDYMSNGGFESGTNGWGVSSTNSSSCSSESVTEPTPTDPLVHTGPDTIDGSKILTIIQSSSASSPNCQLEQSSAVNTQLATASGAGVFNSHMYDTFVLRANVRSSPNISQTEPAAGSVILHAKLNGVVTPDAANLASPSYSVGNGWIPVQLEFTPSMLLAANKPTTTSATLDLLTSLASTDVDGVTLTYRSNLARDPAMVQEGTAGIQTSRWITRALNGARASSVTWNSPWAPVGFAHFFEFSNSSTGSLQVVQTAAQQGTTTLSANGVVDLGRNDMWRLKAKVRYLNLNHGGAALKFRALDANGAEIGNIRGANPIGSCGAAGVLSGTQTTWTDICLDFRPADVIGSGSFNSAEIILEYADTTTGGAGLDVGFFALEHLSD